VIMNLVLVPSLPPPCNVLEIPEDMNPEEEARLLSELGNISTKLTAIEVRADERHNADLAERARVNARLSKLERDVDASGSHDLAVVTKALERAQSHNDKVKWWALSIIATLCTSAIVGLVVHYFSKR